MIVLGLSPAEKAAAIAADQAARGWTKAVMLSPARWAFPVPFETIDWPDIIEYRFFYRLLQEVDANTCVVVNECLRGQNRYDLTYNCIRHILHQAGHVLVLQWLPMIEQPRDFLVLFDFATDSRWKRERYDPDLLREAPIRVTPRPIHLDPTIVAPDAKLAAHYQREKARLFAGLGNKDPHTIPRQLHLLGGALRASRASLDGWHLARNRRLRLERVQTYKEDAYPHGPYTVLDLPHSAGDLVDALSLAQQTTVPVVMTGLPVDRWYLNRYTDWTGRLADAYAGLP